MCVAHDFFYKNRDNKLDVNNYKNTKYFIDAVKNARKYESSHDKLVIIAGACQSNYEELIKAGANFASSPKRINLRDLSESSRNTLSKTLARIHVYPLDMCLVSSR